MWMEACIRERCNLGMEKVQEASPAKTFRARTMVDVGFMVFSLIIQMKFWEWMVARSARINALVMAPQ